MSDVTTRIRKKIQSRFLAGLEETIDWFATQMADYYYRVTSTRERVRHVEIIHSLRLMPTIGVVKIDDVEAGKVVVFGPARADTFAEALYLLGDQQFNHIEIHTTKDRSLAIFAFVYRDQEPPADFNLTAHRKHILVATCSGTDCLPRHVVTRFVGSVSEGYLARSSPERIARHVRAWIALDDPEHLYVTDDDYNNEGKPVARILIAGRMHRHEFANRLADFLSRNDVYLERGYIDEVETYQQDGHLLISTVYLTNVDGSAIGKRKRAKLSSELIGLRRHFDEDLGTLFAQLTYTQMQFEILVAAIDFSAQLLPLEHQFFDVRENGREAMVNHPEICTALALSVEYRFGPKPKTATWWKREHKRLTKAIENTEDLRTATVLEAMLRFVDAIRLTNVFQGQRIGQSFQIDPNILPEEHFVHKPYGIFYFHGRHGMGFQVRFRASARGGLRLLLPRSNEQLLRYRNRLLREVYDLSWAQQLKNKDIPEGGSKCIALVRPGGDADEMVKQMSDSLLDLILPTERCPDVRGEYGAERQHQLIFLGPDENMTPPRIKWVADRAAQRGLPHHATLMSSKAGTGINHKEYGVTSEGVYMWVKAVLPLIGKGSKDKWTLSMTGGPDGDVGGNLIKILHRDDRKRCKIIAIADGSGCAADQDGLNWKELLRLVKGGHPIAAFNPKKLSHEASHVTPVGDRASEELRNSLHSQTEADLFVPCGGRPYTINDRNWHDMLDGQGAPRISGMVEGANIFITKDARVQLEKAGVIVIKDSSANKGGVITSSYEILAGLICSDEEFTDIKDVYVEQTVTKLREMAAEEALALLEAWNRRARKSVLSNLSLAFSEEINRLATLFEPFVSEMRKKGQYSDYWQTELYAHCPAIVVEKFSDRLFDVIPEDHLNAILTKRLASRMLYREGLTWCRNYVVDHHAREALTAFIQAHESVDNLLSQISVPDDGIISNAIIADGTRREIVRRQLGR